MLLGGLVGLGLGIAGTVFRSLIEAIDSVFHLIFR